MRYPISAEMVAWSRIVAEPRWSPDGRRLAWVDASGGRADVVVAPSDASAPPVVVTADAVVTRVGAYGGGAYCWAGSEHLAVAAADGRLLLVPVDGGPPRVLSRDGRAAAPAATLDASRVAFVLERDDACDIAVVPTDGSAWPARASRGADYAWDPAWSPTGDALAWHEWDLTGMSWDASRIVISDAAGTNVKVVASGDDIAVGQPRFAPDGSALAYVSDASGWWNVWTVRPDGADAAPVLSETQEHAEPAWGPGQRSFAWSPEADAIAINRNEGGFGRLVVVTRDGRHVDERSRGWHHALDWSTTGIVCVRSGARTPQGITVLTPEGSRRELARGPVGGFEAAGLVEPEPLTWESDDGIPVHGLLFRPPDTPRPPLLVDVHGGPTGQATAAWNARQQFFVSRGWAVLAPNYRGSTGHGREYMQAMAERWGVVDVADTAAGIRTARANGWCDPDRIAAIGGSAGGLTVLLLCARQRLLRAGVSLYGVTDLRTLAETTHRFESRYLDRIVGDPRERADRYRDRSPVARAHDIRVPVLLLQGADDKVVPPDQAAAFADAVRAAGGTVEHHVYEGEGHGFERPDTTIDALGRIDAFLRKWVLES